MEDNKIVIYQTPDGQTELDVRLQEETVWLNAEQMATLFDRDTKTIRKHINNAIKEELADVVVVAKFATTTQHGAIAGKEVKMDVSRYALQTRRICSTHLPRDNRQMTERQAREKRRTQSRFAAEEKVRSLRFAIIHSKQNDIRNIQPKI